MLTFEEDSCTIYAVVLLETRKSELEGVVLYGKMKQNEEIFEKVPKM